MEGPSRGSSKLGKAARGQGVTSAWARKVESVDVWEEGAMDALQAALRAMTRASSVLLIGTARGGRGFILKTWVEGVPVSEYARTSEEVQEVLESWSSNWLADASGVENKRG